MIFCLQLKEMAEDRAIARHTEIDRLSSLYYKSKTSEIHKPLTYYAHYLLTKMEPKIQNISDKKFLIEDLEINQDFVIDYEGKVRQRKVGDSNGNAVRTLSLAEASDYYDPNINEMIIGSARNDKMMLSYEATDFFEEKRCKVKMLPLDEAVRYWNRYEGRAVGIFHLEQ